MPDRFAIELRARPLRLDTSQFLVAAVMLPGLAMAVAHAPLALFTFGPLVVTTWLVSRRERFALNRATICMEGPALTVRHRGATIEALDLRFCERRTTETGELLLSEEPGRLLCFGENPPEVAYASTGPDSPDVTAPLQWRAVRLWPADFAHLRQAVADITREAPPVLDSTAGQLRALGSVGTLGLRAEERLRRRLRDEQGAPAQGQASGLRESGLRATVQELALREDAVGHAARRVLEG